jgi:lysyl-tRNA synthetase class 2
VPRQVALPPKPRVWSPSDLAAGTPPRRGRRFRLGGRVAALRGARAVALADASAVVEVGLRQDFSGTPGDLLELDVARSAGRLGDARVLAHTPAPESTSDGEFARLNWEGVGRRLRERALALSAVRAYFESEGFVEVATPVRVPAPGLDANVLAVRSEGNWLITSPEHHMKRLLVGGLPRIFQLTPCFRAEELGPLHEGEFTMLEWYRAFSDQEEVMRDTEEVVAQVARALTGGTTLALGKRRIDLEPPFERMSVRAAFRKYAGADALDLAETDADRFFELLVDRVEPGLRSRRRPVFLTNYPLSQAALARQSADDPRTAERFELYMGGVELCNGFSELTDATEQQSRFRAERRARRKAGQPSYPLDQRFLAALGEGMPRAGGNALGFDRLVMLLTGASRVAEVMAFPDSRR